MNKHNPRQLERFGLKNEMITHVCIAPNLYPLLQYLLLMDDDVVFNHTCFFVNEIIPENVRDLLPCFTYNYFGKSFLQKMYRRVVKLKFRFFKYLKYPFLKSAQIYAYDLPYMNLLIGNRCYNLLADAPNWMTLNLQEQSAVYQQQMKQSSSLKGRFQKLIFGNIFVNYYGNNEQCETVYLTEDNISPILEGKKIYINSIQSLWDTSSIAKQKFIKRLFNISDQDIAQINKRPIIFFSQPLMDDCKLTVSEFVKLHTKIFNNYDHTKLIIKTHPRDKFNYKKYFPDIEVYTKNVNIQLLILLGIKPERVVTICSTAIETFPESVECDYFGTMVHSKIEKHLGKSFTPKRKVNYKI